MERWRFINNFTIAKIPEPEKPLEITEWWLRRSSGCSNLMNHTSFYLG